MTRTTPFAPPDMSAHGADAQAEQIALTRVDEAGAVARPSTVGSLHVEAEYRELEAEQPPLWEAEGHSTARPATTRAAGLGLEADVDQDLTKGQQQIAHAARDQYLETLQSLRCFVRRPAKAKLGHLAAKVCLAIGEGAGMATAAIWMGEMPFIAVAMAVSAATATVVAGLSGAEVKDLRQRALRRRDPSELPEAVQSWGHLFRGPDSGWVYVRALLYVSVSIALMLAVALMALRSVVEDPLVGVIFGAIAAAIAAASWVESYMYADEIADAIESARATYMREAKQSQKFAGSQTWRQRAEADHASHSITAEFDRRGEAASAHMRALSARILRQNPRVAGHGTAAESIGQTARRGGENK